MATKKKKTPARKKPVRKPVRKAARKPVTLAPLPEAPAPAPSQRNGRLLALMIGVLLLAVLWRSQRHAEHPEAGTTTAPEGRSIAPSAGSGQAQQPKPSPRPTVRRETAGEIGETSLEFDRSSSKDLTVRCWRPANGQARLDVFGPRNQKVRSLASEAGAAGWQSLKWDGKDENGKAVPAGLYYIRPSAQDLQEVRDVWVKG